MTRNLKAYLAFSVVWSLTFFTSLNWGLVDPRYRWPYIIAASVIYGLGFALVGYLLGRPDDQSAVRYDLRRAYSAVSNIASATIGTLWIIFFQPSGRAGIPIYITILVAFWIVGGIQARCSIKGMSAEELFQ
jgi:hypothetical protein